MSNGLPSVGPFHFRHAENADGIAESNHKNVLYCITGNVTEFGNIWMNELMLYT